VALHVRNLSLFTAACGQAERDTKRFVTDAFRDVGEAVRSRAAASFAHIDTGSAAGFQSRARQKGVAVAQRRRKTTGKRPDYGALQMRHLLRARAAERDRTERELEHALDKITSRFQWPG